ncbi:MAG TPA: LamG-like jellyroll fold domain-containing protein [Candidatus Kryptonia bacterium]
MKKMVNLFNYLSINFLLVLFFAHPSSSSAQQVTILTISQMPNLPAQYVMRNWKGVARGYDSLVFNPGASGRYLPLVMTGLGTENYPGQARFGLYTVVGPTASTGTDEAINCIPAVIGASLAGADKSSQFGYDWSQMCEEWFNKSNGQNIYKNGYDDQTNDDFWYETMPNVFFYELNYLYPHLQNFDSQFVSVANQFTRAVAAMGGATTPWQQPNINHEGFDFLRMLPVDISGSGVSWREPESAGAIGWILYNAYVVTGNTRYRVGAELSMEALNQFPSNPAYELQLSYGAYTAARMNAEIGTGYDVEKIVNWLFTQSVERPWGTITGNWGGYPVDGLVGATDDPTGYAFAMNTFEQIGCLVPLVRYDPRFAAAIGKWVLNASNSARLFYPKYLPAANQDSSYNWAMQYDTSSFIAHEAIHQQNPANGKISPYASGDAITGGWGLTTLALYGSSHVGILGGIIDTTNVNGILRLDLLKTDYYHDNAYPSFLYYNPDSTAQTVNIDVGTGEHDVYDAVSKATVLSSVTGSTSFSISPTSAIVAVIIPPGLAPTYDHDKMLVGGIVVDYHSGHGAANLPPRIKALAAGSATLALGDSVKIYCTASDLDGDQLTFAWQSNGGLIEGNSATITWKAPDTAGVYIVHCQVDDGHGLQDTATVWITVVARINSNPIILGIDGDPRVVNIGGEIQLTCHATDPDHDTLTYTWGASSGSVSGIDSTRTWTAPLMTGYFYVACTVRDGYGGTAMDSLGILVQDFSKPQTGKLVASYPFDNGSANDVSGNNNNGSKFYVTSDSDRFGVPDGEFYFDGTTSYIEVSNTTSLNFQNAITVSFWMKIAQIFSREEYPISHNKWNRWKVSISNGRLRWSITTSAGVSDLDSDSPVIADSLYFVTVIYDGSAMEIFLNGNLNAYAPWSGLLATTNINLMIGAVYPGDNTVSYYGSLDDIRISDYAIPFDDIRNLFVTGVRDRVVNQLPKSFALHQNYPNPFNPSTTIDYDVPTSSHVLLVVYDVLGRRVNTLVDARLQPGRYSVVFNTSGLSSGVYFYVVRAGAFSTSRSMMLIK